MTTIEWTDETWNPLVGCSKVSEGCRNCYAATFARRFSGEGQRYEGIAKHTKLGDQWTGVVRLNEKALDKPLRWKQPRKVFVNSMSDLFHESVPDAWIDRIFGIIARTPWHTYQILTKRPERMHRYMTDPDTPRRIMETTGSPEDGYKVPMGSWVWPLRQVWLGTSVENQPTADERIPLLLKTPAAVRFLSCEPLLGELRLHKWLGASGPRLKEGYYYDCIHWVIAGGESGPKARPMHPDWVRSLRDQCIDGRVPFFFKQWGEWCRPDQLPEGAPGYDGECLDPVRVGKQRASALLDGREWREWPEVAKTGETA